MSLCLYVPSELEKKTANIKNAFSLSFHTVTTETDYGSVENHK